MSNKKLIINIGENENKSLLIKNITHMHLNGVNVSIMSGTDEIHKFIRATNELALTTYNEICDFLFIPTQHNLTCKTIT